MIFSYVFGDKSVNFKVRNKVIITVETIVLYLNPVQMVAH